MITPTASSHGGVPTQDKAKEVPLTFNARAETAARKPMFDEPMSKSVVSFPKPTGEMTPYLATDGRDRRGAHLQVRGRACIKYDVSTERKPRAIPLTLHFRSPNAQVPPQWP
jgi:hypothetical protein